MTKQILTHLLETMRDWAKLEKKVFVENQGDLKIYMRDHKICSKKKTSVKNLNAPVKKSLKQILSSRNSENPTKKLWTMTIYYLF